MDENERAKAKTYLWGEEVRRFDKEVTSGRSRLFGMVWLRDDGFFNGDSKLRKKCIVGGIRAAFQNRPQKVTARI
jgi:hypothetical protein